ncbi:MAG: hypothetical protein ACOYOZ_17745, partial [Pirellula sp.]
MKKIFAQETNARMNTTHHRLARRSLARELHSRTKAMPLGVSLALACAVLGVPLGCSPESKPKEVSAQTSGFRPAEATAGASKPKPQEP